VDFVPSPIPEELQGLIDAYVGGRPFNLFIARSRLYNYWDLSLPEEFGLVMLGFFRVLSVQVRFPFPCREPFSKNLISNSNRFAGISRAGRPYNI